MSEQKTKSNAPWILGIVGFGLSIPQIICSILCAGAAVGVAGAANEAGSSEAASAATSAGITFLLPVFFTIACFILSFFGKSKVSTATGVLLIILGLAEVYLCVINWSPFGIAGAICFACAGVSSICNTKKAKE